MSRVPPETPLRRVSYGSLYALARSQTGAPPQNPDESSYDSSAPASIAFLAPALSQLADEAVGLVRNIQATDHATDMLERFNEGFGAHLYALQMQACVSMFPQAPIDASYALLERRKEEERRVAEEQGRIRAKAQAEADAIAAAEARAAAMRAENPDASNFTMVDMDNSMADTTMKTTSTSAAKRKLPFGKKGPLSAKEKKERGIMIERIVGLLPLAFRGNDPSLRRQVETVIEKMLNDTKRGFKLADLTAPPDLNEAKVRKCILALSGAKIVRSDNSTGTVLYKWVGPPDGR